MTHLCVCEVYHMRVCVCITCKMTPYQRDYHQCIPLSPYQGSHQELPAPNETETVAGVR